jgi:hypothetical protein
MYRLRYAPFVRQSGSNRLAKGPGDLVESREVGPAGFEFLAKVESFKVFQRRTVHESIRVF